MNTDTDTDVHAPAVGDVIGAVRLGKVIGLKDLPGGVADTLAGFSPAAIGPGPELVTHHHPIDGSTVYVVVRREPALSP